jgi:septum site-determining protein MinC
MPAQVSDHAKPSAAFEIKAGSITLPILKLFDNEIERFAQQFRAKVRQAPEFFRHAPIVIDLHELAADREPVDVREIVSILRLMDLVPVGVRGGNPEQHAAAQAAGLAVLAEGRHDNHNHAPAPPPAAAPAPAPSTPPAAKVVDHPVRSGQRIYAAGSDLIVLAQVSAGAEVMADGNIHIYSCLRGRALAGVQGNLDARIFCTDLQAELVAIGGHYKISENLDEGVRRKPVQVYLRDSALIVEPLEIHKRD